MASCTNCSEGLGKYVINREECICDECFVEFGLMISDSRTLPASPTGSPRELCPED